MPTPRYCNCLVWWWLMFRRRGGYFVSRPSVYGPWPHVMWMSPDHTEILGYVPVTSPSTDEWRQLSVWKRLCWLRFGLRLFIFKGLIHREEREEKQDYDSPGGLL
jgi:hypothetical protein